MQYDGFDGIVVLVFPLSVFVYNRLRNEFVGVVFTYPGFEGRRSVNIELCLPIDSMNVLENDQKFMTVLL